MNLVIMPVYELTGWLEVYPWFVKMSELCVASFRLNMADVDDVMIFHNKGRPINSYVEMFRDVFDQTHGLWMEGHNLFFTDADALCVRPVRMFGEFPDFTLFSQTVDNKFPDDFPVYMLSGSRYFPQSMDAGLWELGKEMWAREPTERGNVFGSHWDYEQYVWNHMFFSQPGVRENWEDYIRGEFNLYYEWENRVIDPAILSFNASATWRGESTMTMEERLRLMKNRMINL